MNFIWFTNLRVCQIEAKIVEVENFPPTSKKFSYSKIRNFDTIRKIFSIFVNFLMAFGPTSVPNVSPNEGGGKFFTLIEKFPLPKNSKITRIRILCTNGKFSTFGEKFFNLVRLFFRLSNLRVCQFSAQKEEVENFHFSAKLSFSEKIIPKSHELENSAEVENFQTLVTFFWDPDLRLSQISAPIEEVENFPL